MDNKLRMKNAKAKYTQTFIIDVIPAAHFFEEGEKVYKKRMREREKKLGKRRWTKEGISKRTYSVVLDIIVAVHLLKSRKKVNGQLALGKKKM